MALVVVWGKAREHMDWILLGRVVAVLLQGYSVLMLALILILAMMQEKYRRMWWHFVLILGTPLVVMVTNGDWHVRGM